jgi:gas vesicle protein
MSYAGPSRGSGSARTARSSRATSSTARPTPTRGGTTTAPSSNGLETDWGQVALFGAGLALGITLGAGAALLTAPRSGEETRAVLRGRVGRLRRTAGRKSHDAWDDLRDELAGVKHAIRRRKVKRAAERTRRRELDLEAALE